MRLVHYPRLAWHGWACSTQIASAWGVGEVSTKTMAAVPIVLFLKTHNPIFPVWLQSSLSYHPFTGIQGAYLQMQYCVLTLYEFTGVLSRLLSPWQMKSPLISTGRCNVGSSSCLWCSGLENLWWGWDSSLLRGTSAAKISLLILNWHMWVKS